MILWKNDSEIKSSSHINAHKPGSKPQQSIRIPMSSNLKNLISKGSIISPIIRLSFKYLRMLREKILRTIGDNFQLRFHHMKTKMKNNKYRLNLLLISKLMVQINL